MANWDKAAAIYDERMCRMWEFYLISAQLAFLTGSEMVFHLVLANKRDAVPIVRDYMVDDERVASENFSSNSKIGSGPHYDFSRGIAQEKSPSKSS